MVEKIKQHIASPIMNPLYSLYARISHRRVLRHMSDAIELPVPTISIGNISFGGTAKTPMAEHIARMAVRHGAQPGIVLRGYRGRIDREALPPTLVSDGSTIHLGWEDSGDEARLLAENLLGFGVPVAVGRDRIGGSLLLTENHNVDVIILDDGFQFTSLARDIDLVLVDALAPFGRLNGGSGPLREPARALVRADAVLITRSEAVTDNEMSQIQETLRRLVENLPPVFCVRTRVRGILRGTDCTNLASDDIQGSRIVGFTGIGNPRSFEHTLSELNCEIAELIEFPDHHPYTASDIEKVKSAALKAGADSIVTTCKDAVRVNGCLRNLSMPLHVVDIEVVIEDEDSLVSLLDDKMRNSRFQPNMS